MTVLSLRGMILRAGAFASFLSLLIMPLNTVKAQIIGDEKKPIGSLAVLRLADKSDSVEWICLDREASKTFQVFEDGNVAVFATGLKARSIEVVAVACEVKDDKPILTRHNYTIEITNENQPIDPPTPIDPPEPELKGFAKATYDKAQELVKDVDNEIKADARGFVSNYRSVSTKISSGTLSGAENIIFEIQQRNKAEVESGSRATRSEWLAFFQWLQKELDGAMPISDENVAILFNEIAAGLEAWERKS